MLGVSGMLGNSGDGAASHQSGGGGGGGGEVGVSGPSLGGFSEDEKMRIEDGDRSSGGNRWPRQETIALLKIRSDMDVVFRDSSLKGPLWEEVSRKLADLGYHRSAKKCKEKFENVYKYHKRTKDGRGSKADGKSYRFFDQLEALEQIHQSPVSYAPPLPLPQQPPQQPPQPVVSANPVAVAIPVSSSQVLAPHGTVSSTTNQTISFSQNPIAPIAVNPFPPTNIQPPPPATTAAATTTTTTTNLPTYPYSSLGSMSTSSSSTSSDQEAEPSRKRKWEEFFQKVMKNVVEKQEEMQKKFLEKLERRERERVAREEAWRVQEMARLNREHELMVKERSIAAAKDAAVIAFLEKVSDQHQQVPNINQIQLQPPQPQPQPQAKPSQVHSTPPNSTPVQSQQLPAPPQQHTTPKPQQLQLPAPPQQLPAQPQQKAPPQPQPAQLPTQPQHLPTVQSQAIIPIPVANNQKNGTGGENYIGASPSRWPKAEVQALIQLRTNMDIKYQENGPKGPLWEEISGEMKKIGYNRNAKRCKEKWENINKYFKKVKESNKKRPEDSKTCPYFHQLEALYKEKGKNEGPFGNPGFGPKPENPMVPMMVQPEQQWPLRPPPREQHNHQPDSAMEERDSNENDDDEDDEDDEDEANAYEVVTNKPSTVGNATE